MSDLEALAEKFREWRSEKKSPRSRIPKHLRVAAANLSSSVPAREIAKAISVTSKMVKSWQSQYSPKDQFFELNVPKIEEAPASRVLSFSITDTAGRRLEMSGEFSLKEALVFIQPLLGGES